jgi:hypothetical protein
MKGSGSYQGTCSSCIGIFEQERSGRALCAPRRTVCTGFCDQLWEDQALQEVLWELQVTWQVSCRISRPCSWRLRSVNWCVWTVRRARIQGRAQ